MSNPTSVNNDDRLRLPRSQRIEYAAKAVVQAYDTCNLFTDDEDPEAILRNENALMDAVDALRKELP